MELFKSIPIHNVKNITLSGLTDEVFCRYINTVFKENNDSILIVTSSLFEANMLFGILSNYNDNVYLFPMDDFLTSEAIAISPDLLVNRLETLNEIVKNKKEIVVTNLMGYLRYLPEVKVYKDNILRIKLNDEVSQEDLIKTLINIGYKRESLATKTGEFSSRGFIIDVFPLESEHPVRFEFFGDTIDSIREFDEETQSSISKIDSVSIYPYSEFIVDKELDVVRNQKYLKDYAKVVSILDYLDDPIVF